jgi:hypothetical protein
VRNRQQVSISEPLLVKAASPFLDGLVITRALSRNAKTTTDVLWTRKIELLAKLVD